MLLSWLLLVLVFDLLVVSVLVSPPGADMYAPKSGEPASLTAARNQILGILNDWVPHVSPHPSPAPSSGLSKGAVAGIAVGCGLAVVAAVAAVVIIKRRQPSQKSAPLLG